MPDTVASAIADELAKAGIDRAFGLPGGEVLPLIDALRLSGRRPGNASTVSSLMHAIDHFRRPRPESVLTPPELRAIAVPTMFIWGTDAPYLVSDRARPSIAQIPSATLHEVPGGHGPWLVDTERSAQLIQSHLGPTAGLAD